MNNLYNVIYSEISKDHLLHFNNLQAKIDKHRLKQKLLTSKITTISIQLLDMLTFEPLKTPVRGVNCTHWECIDETSADCCFGMKCPLCEEMFEEYEKDEYLLEILSKGNFYGIHINTRTGLYFPFNKNNDEIDWNFDFLKYLALKNTENLMPIFCYQNKDIGIDEIMFKISLFDKFEQKLLEIPCRSLVCKHVNCFDLKEVWKYNRCDYCGNNVDENNIYIDILQYGIVIFMRKTMKLENMMQIKYFRYFPEEKCFQIEEEFYNLNFEKISMMEKENFINRINNLKDLKEKSDYLDGLKTTKKTDEIQKTESEETCFIKNFVFPEPQFEILELHYENIEKDIEFFENNKKN